MTTEIAEYSATEAALADLSSRYRGVVYPVETPKGMAAAKEARKELASYRIALEKKRVEIKAPALRRAQLIDSEAKRISTQIAALEDPIDNQIKAKERAEQAAREAAIQAEKDRIAAEERAKKEAEEAKLAAERAEIAKQREALAAEQRAREEADRQARLKIEQEQRDARAKIEEEQRQARLAREAEEAKAKALREAEEARLKAERDKIEAERRAVEEAARKEREAAEAKAAAERRAKEDAERKEREARESIEREAKRKEAEKADAAAMLVLFKKRYGHLPQYAAVIEAIDACMVPA